MADSEKPGNKASPDGDHWLYRCYDADLNLLYIGITSAGFKRFRRHGNDREWWAEVDTIKVDHHPSGQAAHAAEIEAIRKLKPRYNVNHAIAALDVVQLFRRCSFCDEHFRPVDNKKHCLRCAAWKKVKQRRGRRDLFDLAWDLDRFRVGRLAEMAGVSYGTAAKTVKAMRFAGLVASEPGWHGLHRCNIWTWRPTT